MCTLQTKLYKQSPSILLKMLLGITLFLTILQPCFAADLMDIYQAALKNDTIYQAAVSTRLSSREAIPQSLAGLLPSIKGHAYLASNYYKNITPATRGASNGTSSFHSDGYNISITQPLLNVGNWLTVKQANNAGRQADATLGAAAQSLVYRVAEAYFQVLLAEDNLYLAQSEKAATAKQLEQAQHRVRVGLDALTTVYAAKADYDRSVAQEIDAQNILRNSQENIRQITGQTYAHFNTFKQKMPLLSPQPANVEQWITTATSYNLVLAERRYAMAAARDNIKVKASGHLPVVSVAGSYGRADGINLGLINQNNAAVELDLDFPIFSGGAVVSNTRQAEYDFQTASANLEKEYRSVLVTTRQKYNDVLADISKIQAERQAIKSAQLSLNSTQESFSAGTVTIVDVLLAQKKLYDAKRNAASDQYTYLKDSLSLKQAAGTLKPEDLQKINRWLH